MRNFFAFIEKHSFILLFIVLQIISFLLIINFNEPQKSKFGVVSNSFLGRLHSITETVTRYFYLEEANKRLVDENKRLHNSLPESQFDNTISGQVLWDSLHEQQYEYLAAKVLKNSTNKIQNFITIDRGWRHGVQPNMAVICPMGVVGIVVRCSKHFSTIMTVLNPNFKVSAKFKKSEFYGSLTWDCKDYKIATLEEIPLHAIINEGDTLVTNSYSNLFPSGIMVGTVESYYQNDNFFSVKVLLSTDFKRVNYVYVVKDLFKKERENIENGF